MADGKARRNADDPICSKIENGPSRRTSNLLEGRVVCNWRCSSHTFQPTTRFQGRTATLIGRAFHCLPCLFELPLQNILNLPELVDIGVGSRGPRIQGRGQEGHSGMEAIVGKKRGEGSGRMLGVII